MKKTFFIIIIPLLVLALIYVNTTITTDSRQGYLEPLSALQPLIVDTPQLAITTLDFGDNSPFNLVFYLNGYPEKDTYVEQNSYWFTWKPTGKIFCIWLVQKKN